MICFARTVSSGLEKIGGNVVFALCFPVWVLWGVLFPVSHMLEWGEGVWFLGKTVGTFQNVSKFLWKLIVLIESTLQGDFWPQSNVLWFSDLGGLQISWNEQKSISFAEENSFSQLHLWTQPNQSDIAVSNSFPLDPKFSPPFS